MLTIELWSGNQLRSCEIGQKLRLVTIQLMKGCGVLDCFSVIILFCMCGDNIVFSEKKSIDVWLMVICHIKGNLFGV